MKGEKNRIKLSVGIASTACTRCVPKTTYDIPKKHKEGSASRMQMWELEMYAASSYFPRHRGGGGVITFLGLDVGRKNHQGRNFHFLSTFWESYSTSPVRLCTAFAPLSLCFLELWRHSCCMLKLGPMVDMSVPTSGLHPRFSLLRQQTSNSWSVHWNMLHIGIYWMKHKGN